MSENDDNLETVAEEEGAQPQLSSVTTADKRAWLKANGHDNVGSRGKLSAEHEQAYTTGTRGDQDVPTAL